VLRLGAPVGFAVSIAILLALGALPGSAAAKTVWLCKPGLVSNPCEPKLNTTQVTPTGQILGVQKVKRQRNPKVDCFYVYPTVSDQQTQNANLKIDPAERSIALYQAARYSQRCRVFAPMYRQVTVGGLVSGVSVFNELAYSDVLRAWRTYLRKYNHGRGVVLIGHSQGTFVLRRLLTEQIDPSPAARAKLVSAILLGGNTVTAAGQDSGGDFRNIPACRAPDQLGCAIAFSTFDAPVPGNAIFGHAPAGQQVLCTNPAALAGGVTPLKTVFPSKPFAPFTSIADQIAATGYTPPHVSTPFLEIDGGYTGGCSTADDASVLQVSPQGGAPLLNPNPDPTWGIHIVDANIAQGNLVDLVGSESRAYVKARGCKFKAKRGWYGCSGG
jgi:hypothetical protein